MHDVSLDLDLAFWQEWFMEQCNKIPHTRDTWGCHLEDALGLYLAGGEL